MNSAKVIGPPARMRPQVFHERASGLRAGAARRDHGFGGRFAGHDVLALWIAGKHFDDEIVQAIIELFLKNPGKLLAFDLAGTQQENIHVHLRFGGE